MTKTSFYDIIRILVNLKTKFCFKWRPKTYFTYLLTTKTLNKHTESYLNKRGIYDFSY